MPELDDGVQLSVDNLHMSFGGVAALRGVSIQVRQGEIFSIIGPNGAGKTVLLNCISGLYRPQRGKILFEGKDITHLRPYQRARLGLSRSFQKIELFRGMTVLDNIRLGRHIHMRAGLLDGGIYLGGAAREEIQNRDFIEREIVDLLEIAHIRNKVVGMLPYGLQKRVELARALALQPKILLLDEPMAGLNLEEVEDMARFILDANEDKKWLVTGVLVEHDMGVVMDISHHVAVLNFGEKIAEGAPEEIQRDERVHEAYLGEKEELYVTRR
jgi:branched-chain amino acid transport system ATP-binding protein